MSVIVALSGGKASAYCAGWAFRNFNKEDIILYFNDTKWEHPDLYRFLNDLSKHFSHPLTVDSLGISPEDLFKKQKMLGNNRVPLCSRKLKSEQLQKFFKDGDTIVFGIGLDEKHRAERLTKRYETIRKTRKPILRFPLIEENVTKEDIDNYLEEIGIEEPYLYKLGFPHNNCSGGCVRAGKNQWYLLYKKLPEVYADRERVENELRELTGKDIHYLKDETLEHLRKRIDSGEFKPRKEWKERTECLFTCGY